MAPKRGGYRKRRSGGYRKRRAVARRTNGGKVSLMRNSLVPDRMITKLVYKDNINLAGTNPNPWTSNQFRLNSIYDPDQSIVNGHQPLGRDQWSNFYLKYRVFKAVVSCTFINNATTGVQVGIIPFNYDSALLLDDSTFELPHVKSATIGGNTGVNKKTLTKVVDIPRIMGKSHVQYKTDPNTGSTFGTNPNNQCALSVACRTINDSAAPLVQAIINITYYVEFFDRINPRISYPQGKNPSGAFKDQAGNFINYAGSTMTYLETVPYMYISTISSP